MKIVKRHVHTGAVLAIAASLWAVPATSSAADSPQQSAADSPRRVANLNSNGPGLTAPYAPASGRAVLTLYPNAGKVCYSYRWEKMPMRSLYLHRRSDQEIVVRVYDEYETNSGNVQGCAKQDVPEAQVRKFIRYPKRFYLRAQDYSGSAQISGILHRPAS